MLGAALASIGYTRLDHQIRTHTHPFFAFLFFGFSSRRFRIGSYAFVRIWNVSVANCDPSANTRDKFVFSFINNFMLVGDSPTHLRNLVCDERLWNSKKRWTTAGMRPGSTRAERAIMALFSASQTFSFVCCNLYVLRSSGCLENEKPVVGCDCSAQTHARLSLSPPASFRIHYHFSWCGFRNPRTVQVVVA